MMRIALSAVVSRTLPTFIALTFALSSLSPETLRAQSTADAVPIVPPSLAALPGKGPSQKLERFQRSWKQRRTEWAGRRAQDEGAVVFLGDSITEGWESLAQDFPDLKVANRGISGDTTRGLLYRLPGDVLSLKPAAVVVLIGTNDLGLGAKPADVAENLRDLLAALKQANPKMPVIVCTVTPSSPGKNRPASKIKTLNAFLDAVMKDNPQCVRCDTWSVFADENGNAKKAEFPDLLHPNAAGYAKWAAALQPIFARLELAAAQKK